MGAAFVFEGDGGKAVVPGVRCGEGHGPELVGGGVGGDFAFQGRRWGRGGTRPYHVDLVDGLAVGGVGIPHGQFSGVVLRLGQAFGEGAVPGFGFDNGELGVAVDEDVVGDFGVAAAVAAFQAAEGDVVFAEDAAVFDDAPAGGLEGWVDVFGACFGFVHDFSSLPLLGRY